MVMAIRVIGLTRVITPIFIRRSIKSPPSIDVLYIIVAITVAINRSPHTMIQVTFGIKIDRGRIKYSVSFIRKASSEEQLTKRRVSSIEKRVFFMRLRECLNLNRF